MELLLLSDPALNRFSEHQTAPCHLLRFVRCMLTIAFDQKNVLLPTYFLRSRIQKKKRRKGYKNKWGGGEDVRALCKNQ